MPKKTDGMLFELLPRPTKGDDGKPLLYPRPAIGFKYTTQAVDNFCSKYRSMNSGDLTHLFETFLDAASWLMRDGSRIETPIGSFAPRLRLDGEYTDPKKVQSKNVSFAGIEFIPSKCFEDTVEEKILYGYRQKKEVIERHPLSDPDELEKALQKSMFCGFTTVQRFCYYSGLRYNSSKRFLDSLCKGDNPRFRRSKEGTAYHYVPVKKKQNK